MRAVRNWIRRWHGGGVTTRGDHAKEDFARLDAAVDESRDAAHRAGNAAMVSIGRSNETRRALDELLRELRKSERRRA